MLRSHLHASSTQNTQLSSSPSPSPLHHCSPSLTLPITTSYHLNPSSIFAASCCLNPSFFFAVSAIINSRYLLLSSSSIRFNSNISLFYFIFPLIILLGIMIHYNKKGTQTTALNNHLRYLDNSSITIVQSRLRLCLVEWKRGRKEKIREKNKNSAIWQERNQEIRENKKGRK